MAIFNPYNIVTNNPELLNNPLKTYSADALANMFSMKVPEHETHKFYQNINYRIQKLNKLLMSRGVRLVTHSTNPPTYSISDLSCNRTYMRSQATRSHNASTRLSLGTSGITLKNTSVTKEEYRLIKYMY